MVRRNVRLTICIATTTQRAKPFRRLMRVLLPQVDKHNGAVEILVFFNNYEYSLGFLRQSMLEDTRGQYICHIDDDDMVPADYVDTILPLLDGVDYIGFKVKFIDKGRETKPVYHSLRYHAWHQDSDGYYRRITHLNPVRTDLALMSRFPVELNSGEDEAWANGVTAESEHFIDREMYIYNHEGDDYLQLPSPHDTPVRPMFISKNVRFHPRSTHVHKTM